MSIISIAFIENDRRLGFKMIHKQYTLYNIDPQKGTVCLNLSMWEEGYGYAIIGWADEALEFYKKSVNAIVIEDSAPGVYKRMIVS